MTDYFALLDQSRQPWLAPEELKAAFHEKSRLAHPDAKGSEAAFAEINEAYQVLQDPRRRLQHLLTLEGRPPAAGSGMVPQEIADTFQAVAAATQTAEAVLQKSTTANNPLSRSLLTVEVVRARTRIDESLAKLGAFRRQAEAELRQLSAPAADAGDRIARLQNLYFRYAYLTRWISQLEEKKTQLAAL